MLNAYYKCVSVYIFVLYVSMGISGEWNIVPGWYKEDCTWLVQGGL